MGNVTTIGLDLAKSVFQVHGVDANGAAVLRQRLTRSRMLKFFTKLPPCLIGIEACASSHYWARELIALEHDVKLFVKAGRSSGQAVAPSPRDPSSDLPAPKRLAALTPARS